jgi:hypothetical protein
VKRRRALAVVGPAEGRAPVRVGAESDEGPDRPDAAAGGRPGERRAPIDVGVRVGAPLDQRRQRVGAIGARRPRERLVEDLLRIVGGPPGREAAVGAVEGAVGAGLGAEASVRPDQLVDQVEEPQAGRRPQVARMKAPIQGELHRHPVAPEERDHERRAAVAAGGDVRRGAGLEQHLGEIEPSEVRGLVQRRPAMDVPAARVCSLAEEQGHEALVTGRRRHPEEVVVVGAPDRDDPGDALEQVAQGVRVAGLDRPVRTSEGLLRQGRRAHALAERPPVGAVRARERDPGAPRRERRPRAPEHGQRRLGAVLRRRQEALRPILVVAEVLPVGLLAHRSTSAARPGVRRRIGRCDDARRLRRAACA